MVHIKSLLEDLCNYTTGVVATENQSLFERVHHEYPVKLHRYPSASSYNGWEIQKLWTVQKALIKKEGRVVFNGTNHPLGVGIYSKSFQGQLDFEALKQHLVTKPELPTAYVYHCMWQYRPWAPDWALCVPYEIYQQMEPGTYEIELETTYTPGEMLVGELIHPGRSEQSIVFNSHICHPHMANDGFCGSAIFIRLLQWLQSQETYYTYRLIMAPEHLGTIFYMRDRTTEEKQNLVSGIFVEMAGTPDPIKVTSTFLGHQPIDQAFQNILSTGNYEHVFVPWRQGAGNDETVWEAPGYEVPFVEMTRCQDTFNPFPEYHTSLDTLAIIDEARLLEFYEILKRIVFVLEHNAKIYRKFDGLLCLSNPDYNLYRERPDPSVEKILTEDSDKWGYLQDCLLRYMDGSMTILDIALKHKLPFERIYHYLLQFQEKDLIRLEFVPIERVTVSQQSC